MVQCMFVWSPQLFFRNCLAKKLFLTFTFAFIFIFCENIANINEMKPKIKA